MRKAAASRTFTTMIQYDALLVHYLARELNERLAGAGASVLRLDPPTRVAALETTAGTLVLDLHPGRGVVMMGTAPAAATVLTLPHRAAIAAVTAPPDERLLVLELARAPVTRVRRLIVELFTNQWNVVAVDGTDRIVGLLWQRRAGDRPLRAGLPYRPPPAPGRMGVAEPLPRDEWVARMAALPPSQRERALVAQVGWTSPLNASAILGDIAATPRTARTLRGPEAKREGGAAEADPAAAEVGADADLLTAYERYRALAQRPAPRPCVLHTPRGPRPYPLPLPGILARPAPSLLDAIALAAGVAAPTFPEVAPPPGAAVAPELLERARRRLRALETRARRLEAQAAGAREEAAALRRRGDVLLANLHAARKGMPRLILPDFAGGELEVELNPALTPTENASRLYAQARRRERAAERVPALVAAVHVQRERLTAALQRAKRGEAEAGELDELTRAVTSGAVPSQSHAGAEERLPYRRYRTSGGLEARVGRSRRDNDQLTFHHSSPDDVWLHARDVGGAHVILRWNDAGANPPRRDLAEAAVLAAVHSRARTSGTVAVDWTRRKYVRKPRKAPPGLVVPERVATIFVEPDAGVERRLRG